MKEKKNRQKFEHNPPRPTRDPSEFVTLVRHNSCHKYNVCTQYIVYVKGLL